MSGKQPDPIGDDGSSSAVGVFAELDRQADAGQRRKRCAAGATLMLVLLVLLVAAVVAIVSIAKGHKTDKEDKGAPNVWHPKCTSEPCCPSNQLPHAHGAPSEPFGAYCTAMDGLCLGPLVTGSDENRPPNGKRRHNVASEVTCRDYCTNEAACVGYNYGPNVTDRGSPNKYAGDCVLYGPGIAQHAAGWQSAPADTTTIVGAGHTDGIMSCVARVDKN